MSTRLHYHLLVLFIFICSIITYAPTSAQSKTLYVRIARVVVDSAQLDNYKAALKEGIETAVRIEPGVISLQAVFDEKNPAHITVLETYDSKEAYQLHIQTPHFKKYKTNTQSMVKSLELTDVVPIALATKPK